MTVAGPGRGELLVLQARLREQLLADRTPGGGWEGELAGSALAAAVAICALLQAGPEEEYAEAITRGTAWLDTQLNTDGGFGDCPSAPSNVTTTLAGWSAICQAAEAGFPRRNAGHALAAWLDRHCGSLEPAVLAGAIAARYGQDRTFAAPVLLLAALAGRLGPLPDGMAHVPVLPCELAALPSVIFRWLRLPVVSYAIPALAGIGLARHRLGPQPASLTGQLREVLAPGILRVLQKMQPSNGGYLEAVPLTGFVVMGLAAAGWRDHPVTLAGYRFLLASQRPDGSWPIDSSLTTWLTSLAVRALAVPDPSPDFPRPLRLQIQQWLLAQQFAGTHPFTGAAPGGWSWTWRPGGVPDADDTAGALLALQLLDTGQAEVPAAAAKGIRWLLGMQNRDGGIPTFCRGWGKLPFDRSCPDITAHTLRAWAAWRDQLPLDLQQRLRPAMSRAYSYLIRTQRITGSWVPLWFGNAGSPGGENPVYGTALVAKALSGGAAPVRPAERQACRRGLEWLRSVQNRDGGWGGNAGVLSSVEETALALSALGGQGLSDPVVARGCRYLLQQWENGRTPAPAPIGLYFASLWYSERLYPVIFTLQALQNVLHERTANYIPPPEAAEEGIRHGEFRLHPAGAMS